VYNSRGLVSHGLNDGGRQERELSAKYKKMSDAVNHGLMFPQKYSLLPLD
jgi:hypothetical protein